MRLLALFLTVFVTASAQGRLKCSTDCTLVGPNIKETQGVYYYDGFLYQSFLIENLNGHRVSGGFSIDGDPNVRCGNLKSVWVNVDEKRFSWSDNEITFNIEGVPHKFSCEKVQPY